MFQHKEARGDAGLRRAGPGEDPDGGGPRGAAAGGGRQGAGGPQRRQPRAPGGQRVTRSRSRRRPPRSTTTGPDAFLRHGGRGLLLAMYAALRSLKLYPVENATVQKALDDLQTAAAQLLSAAEPRSRSASPATSSSSTRPASGSSSTTTPRSATSWPCCAPARSGSCGRHRGRAARVAGPPERLLLTPRPPGPRRRACEELRESGRWRA